MFSVGLTASPLTKQGTNNYGLGKIEARHTVALAVSSKVTLKFLMVHYFYV